MKVLSKREFNKLQTESLFNKGGTLNVDYSMPFCTGKYNKKIIGHNVVDIDGVKAVFALAKRDAEGTYYKLYSAK